MQRRAPNVVRAGVVAVVATLFAVGFGIGSPVAAEASPASPAGAASAAWGATAPEATVPPDGPPVTVSDFIPTDSNLSDCVGLVEKPGCGSRSRGGWRQWLVFGALALGLGFVGWRISVEVRRNRPVPDAD